MDGSHGARRIGFWRARHPTVLATLLFLLGLCVCASRANHTKWVCHNTICEVTVHFCNEESERCEACHDYAHQCFTGHQERNCSVYCMDARWKKIREQNCTDLPVIKHGYRVNSQSTVAYKANVKFECEDGYILTGENVLWCDDYGRWSSVPPVCQEITCKLPTKISDNAYFNFIPSMRQNVSALHEANVAVGSKLRFQCKDGLKLQGTSDVTCMSNGKWDIDKLPACLEKERPKQGIQFSTETVLASIFGVLFPVTLASCCVLMVKLRNASTQLQATKTTMMNGEVANGFVANEIAREENETLLKESNTRNHHNSTTNLKQLGDGSELGPKSDNSTASLSSLDDSRSSSCDYLRKKTSVGSNISTGQWQANNEVPQRDKDAIIMPVSSSQPVIIYNELHVIQNACHSPNGASQPFPNPDDQNDTRDVNSVQETGEQKSCPPRSIRPVQPSSIDAENREELASMVQASMPKQENTVDGPFSLVTNRDPR